MQPDIIRRSPSPNIPIPSAKVKEEVREYDDFCKPLLPKHFISPTPRNEHFAIEKYKVEEAARRSNPDAFDSIHSALTSFGEAYHGLNTEEIENLVYKVLVTLADFNRKGEAVESVKQNNKTTDVYYNLDIHTAFAVFKTNYRSGQFREGINAAKITWYKPQREPNKPRQTIIPIVDKVFYLTPKEGAEKVAHAHKEPFQLKLIRNLCQEDIANFAQIAVRCHFFAESHPLLNNKSIGFYSYCRFTLAEAVNRYPHLGHCYLYDSLKALEWLHAKGIVHGNISWSNLLVTEELRVVLSDFSCAFLPSQEKPKWDAHSYGTFPYSAPELLQGDFLSTFATDIWAWGILAYTIGRGKNPQFFDCLTRARNEQNSTLLLRAMEMQKNQTTSRTRALEALDSATESAEVIKKISVLALQDLPERRYSAKELIRVMEERYVISEFDSERQEQIAEDKLQVLALNGSSEKAVELTHKKEPQ